MDTNREIETLGIVLYETRFKNSSKVIEILTKELGKLSIVVLGAYKPNSGLQMATTKLVESRFILNKVRENYYIKDAKIINNNIELTRVTDRYITAEIIIEIIRKSSIIKMREKNVFELLEATLNILKDENLNPNIIKAGFMIKYISLIGFKPWLDSCILSGSKDFKNMYFSNQEGGLIHASMIEENMDIRKISIDEIILLKSLLYYRYIDYFKIQYSDKILNNVSVLVRDYLFYYTEIDYLSYENRQKRLNDLGGD